MHAIAMAIVTKHVDVYSLLFDYLSDVLKLRFVFHTFTVDETVKVSTQQLKLDCKNIVEVGKVHCTFFCISCYCVFYWM